MLLSGGPGPRTLPLDNEAAVFDALRQADAIVLESGELAQLFAWYSHIPPEMAEPGSGAVRLACVELMENFSLRRITVTQQGREAAQYSLPT